MNETALPNDDTPVSSHQSHRAVIVLLAIIIFVLLLLFCFLLLPNNKKQPDTSGSEKSNADSSVLSVDTSSGNNEKSNNSPLHENENRPSESESETIEFARTQLMNGQEELEKGNYSQAYLLANQSWETLQSLGQKEYRGGNNGDSESMPALETDTTVAELLPQALAMMKTAANRINHSRNELDENKIITIGY